MIDENLDHVYPGIDRLYFFLSKMGLMMAMIFCVFYFSPDSQVTKIAGLGATIAGFVLDVMRLRNMGVSQWFAMLRFVPYVNFLFMIGLQSAQTGWIEKRRLDRDGIAIAAAHFALIALVIFLAYWGRIEFAMFR